MTTRANPPSGAPTWAEVWTSDVERCRSFYGELFGWESTDPVAEFGGYFQFMHNGAPVAGGMGDGPDAKANNSWTPYFHTADAANAAKAVAANGGNAHFEPMAVADLGSQFQFSDPQGAVAGVWQPDTFVGFTTIEEPGTPSWFELHTRDHSAALKFYSQVLGWEYDPVSDVDEFRYFMARNPDGGMGMAGLMDNQNDFAEGDPAYWAIYWGVADIDATIAVATKAGATVSHPAEDTPYGQLAELADPMGAKFSLRSMTAS